MPPRSRHTRFRMRITYTRTQRPFTSEVPVVVAPTMVARVAGRWSARRSKMIDPSRHLTRVEHNKGRQLRPHHRSTPPNRRPRPRPRPRGQLLPMYVAPPPRPPLQQLIVVCSSPHRLHQRAPHLPSLPTIGPRLTRRGLSRVSAHMSEQPSRSPPQSHHHHRARPLTRVCQPTRACFRRHTLGQRHYQPPDREARR